MLRVYNIKKVNVPSYPELKVDSFWNKIKSNPEYLSFFPDYKPKKLPPRDYMFNLLHTIDSDLIESKILESHERRKVKPKLDGDEYIEVVPELLKEILDVTYYTSKHVSLKIM